MRAFFTRVHRWLGLAVALFLIVSGLTGAVISWDHEIHGSLNRDLLFYLKARGIPAKEAEALMIQAFVGEAIEGIEHAGLRDALLDQVAHWLKERA